MSCPLCKSTDGYKRNDRQIVCARCGQTIAVDDWNNFKKRRNQYNEDMHGSKTKHQKRFKTTGKTHESEHTVGYEVFGDSEKRGGSDFAKYIENTAPAYQEDYDQHRFHIGTGTHKNFRGTGESSGQYRSTQRSLVKGRTVGSAVQMNQLYYAHQPGFQDQTASGLGKADESFEHMVDNFGSIPFQFEGTWERVGVSETEKAEMSLSRYTARNATFPSRKQELEQMKRFNILPSQSEELPKTVADTEQRDEHGIPMDGSCLFHSIWNRLNQIRDNMGFTSSQEMRRQAVGFLRRDPDVRDFVTLHYLQAMSQPQTWGGELECMALAYVWGARITVIGPTYQITYNAQATDHITIYYNGTSHYSIGQTSNKSV